MKGEFGMSITGKLTFSLGIQAKQMEKRIFINQAKYTKELLKKFGMENAKTLGTLMIPSTKLNKDENGKSVDEKKYRCMIGSLLYLIASRPEINTNLILRNLIYVL